MKRLSITLMAMLAPVTVLAVAVAMYFVANWFAKPIQLVGESMGEVARAASNHRINEHLQGRVRSAVRRLRRHGSRPGRA